MKQHLKELADQAESISAEVDRLLENPSQENLLKAQELNAQFKTLTDSIDRFKAVAKDAESNRLYLSRPIQDVPFDTGASLVGMKSSGSAEITSAGTFLDPPGEEGLFDEKTWKTLSDPQYKSAFRSYLRKGEKGLTGAEIKTLQEGSDSAGGFFVPEDFVQRLIQRKATPTSLQDRVTRLTTSRDAAVLPRVTYSADDLYSTGIRATFTGEIPSSSTAARVTDPTFGQARVPIYTAMLSMPLTNNMVEDAGFPIQSWCEAKFAETIRLLKENMILNGTGIGQPTGILSNPGGAGQPAVIPIGNPITADGLVKMAWSVPEQYDENLAWVFNKTGAGQQIAELKDASGRYLWGSGLQDSGLMESAGAAAGGKRLLQGYPVVFQGFMPSPAANAYPVLFGDLRGYYMVERIGFSVQVLRELYAETNQVMLLGRVRFGGQVCEEFRMRIGQQA